MPNIAEKIYDTQQRIRHSAINVNRSFEEIRLLAVSKTQPPSRIAEAYSAGQRLFGENYLQEARDKQQALSGLDIEWHFIGPIQSNKTRDIATHFHWVHSVDRLKIAERLNNQRPTHLDPLNICLQINIDNEKTKAGATVEELPFLVNSVNALPNLALRGLMALPAKRESRHSQEVIFTKVAQVMERLSHANASLNLDTLSMGMSDDLEAAIHAGSTIVRIGSDIFGRRP